MFYLPNMDKSFVHTLCQANGANSLPHQPQLQTVNMATALYRLVPNVQIHVVEFVLLEEVCGIGAVALLQQVLRTIAEINDHQRSLSINH